jgi:DNA-damage-inducible protein J
MTLDATVRARVDSKLKADVEVILKKVGLNTSQAINIFLNSVKNNNGIPFELKIPNTKTIKAMEEAEKLEGETVSFEEFIKHA